MIGWCKTHGAPWAFDFETEDWLKCLVVRMWDAHADLDLPEDAKPYEDCVKG